MSNEHFDFKQFSIQQDRCAMKVGTDGVLLGAWAPVDFEDDQVRVLDIGTGTGLIALMIAQRLSEAHKTFMIDALEIDADAALQAQENIQCSRWRDGINVIKMSLQRFGLSDPASKIGTDEIVKYNVIVSNPPFYNATLKPSDEARAVARHKDSLPLSEITTFAKQHLTDAGTLSLIYPVPYDTEVMTAATLSGIHPIALCDVVTKKGKPCKRRMATFALSSHPQKDIDRQSLFIRDEKGEYTDEYLRLVESFYLCLN